MFSLRRNSVAFATLMLFAASLWGCEQSPTTPLAGPATAPSTGLTKTAASSQWVVVLEPGSNPQSFAADHGLVMISVLGEANLYLFQGAGDQAALQSDPRVHSVQPNEEMVLSEPVDLIMGFYEGSWDESSYPRQNALGRLNLAAAHRKAIGSGVTVAVLDTGVDMDHPHLSAVVQANPIPFLGQSETTPNGIDDDGDGKVDEAFGHGTHVAGIISTVAPGATILPIRVLNDDGVGTAFDLAVGLYEAFFLQVDVVNLSLSLSGYSPVIADVLQRLDSAGVQIVAAAGNTGDAPSYPATDPVTVGVAALEANQLLATFSGRGDVPLGAPGVRVVSSFPGGQLAEASGTSMACAVVAGSLALLIEQSTGATTTVDPRLELFESATPIAPSGSLLFGAVSPTRALGIADDIARQHLPSVTLR